MDSGPKGRAFFWRDSHTRSPRLEALDWDRPEVTIPIAPPPPPIPCPGRLGCAWSEHGRKHFPHRGLRPEHTRSGPAKYLPGTTDDQIRSIETTTVGTPGLVLSPPPGKSEYVRSMDRVIGWDLGQDATISFAECSGGVAAGRSYHGRPMAPPNPKLRGTAYAGD